MRDIISFSLYGSDALYCRGAIENARLARGLYPEWGCRFYCSNDVPGEIVSGLLAEDAEIIMLTLHISLRRHGVAILPPK